MSIRRAIPVALAAWFAGVAPAAAQTAYDADWRCWYERGREVNCLLLKASQSQSRPRDTRANPRARATPKQATQIQAAGADLHGQVVSIPLLTEPDDEVLMRQLAHFSVCGSSPSCRMIFTRDQREIVLLQMQASDGY